MYRLLVIQGDTASDEAGAFATLTRDQTLHCAHATWHDVTPEGFQAPHVDAVVAVVHGDQARAASLLTALRERAPGIPVIVVLPPDHDEALIRVVLQSADDFVVDPPRALELRHRLARLLPARPHEEAGLVSRLLEELALTRLVGRDPAFVRALTQVPRFARSDAAVLITGETGTGKELCARAIHHLSRRRNAPFIAVDCGAVPDQLFENELFGHARGAFTDAHRDHKGLVAMADGGTLFLDEVDALSLIAQAKLLRFLQEHSFRPLGADRFDRANVKVIAASNRDLDACVRDKQLRADLYFRLNVLRIHLPPLRERAGDIPLLAESILKECGASLDPRPTMFSAAALRVLANYAWPGNVRELYNVVQRAIVSCEGDRILPSHLSLGEGPLRDETSAGDFRTARATAVAAFERRYVEDLLRKHHGNVTHAAREARQDRRAFGRFIKKYRIERQAL